MNLAEKILLVGLTLTLLLCVCADAGAEIVHPDVIKTIAFEASNQSLEGQIWVACVIRNRARERGISHRSVCLQPKQFSCWNDVIEPRALGRAEMESARLAWEESEDYWWVDATHYHADYAQPYWASSMKFIKQIDNHLFYMESK